MNTAIVYHWWSIDSDLPPHQNIRVPLIGSIATLRAVDSTVPVYVLDGSDTEINWNNFDNLLNFKVIKIKFHLSNYNHRNGWQNLSRLFDLNRLIIPEDIIFYCDADVFWLKSPLPLKMDSMKFCFNGYNSGLFYFNKTSSDVCNFFTLFEAFALTALNDTNFRIITRQYSSMIPFFVIDEQILIYMQKKMSSIFNIISTDEHFALSSYQFDFSKLDFSIIRNLHLHSVMVENPVEPVFWKKTWNRGAAILMIQELYQLLTKVCSNQLESTFSQELLEYTSTRRQSLLNPIFQERLFNSKDSSGYFHLTSSLNESTII